MSAESHYLSLLEKQDAAMKKACRCTEEYEEAMKEFEQSQKALKRWDQEQVASMKFKQWKL